MKKNKIKYYDLIRELAITDFKLKYQGSVAGYLWSLAKPLMIFGVLYMVFNVFVRIGSSISYYPLYLLLGVILWSYFAETTSIGMRAIVDKGDMIRKVYFPKTVLVISASISALITLLLNLLVVFIFMIMAPIFLNSATRISCGKPKMTSVIFAIIFIFLPIVICKLIPKIIFHQQTILNK